MIQQKIYDMIELTKHNKVPVLLMSNPGYGKTTIVNRYAAENGYHVEVLIGSRHSHEDILGYQVNNGGSSLDHINPSWYERIIQNEKKGIPSILFVDELPTSPEYVQGALLSVICDREIAVGKPIPDSTIIIAAGNYSENMPDHFNLLSSIVNRFCVVNIKEGESIKNILDEFLSNDEPLIQKPSLVKRTDTEKAETKNKVKELMLKLFSTFRAGSSGGELSLDNAELRDIYSAENGAVYNFITPRTINYYAKMIESCLALSIHNKDTLSSFANGLLGRGTNSFGEELQYKNFRESLETMTFDLVKSSLQKRNQNIINYNNTICDDVNTFLTASTTMSSIQSPFEMIKPLIIKIKEEYGVEKSYNKMHEILSNLDTLDDVKTSQIISDINAIELLISEVKSLSREDDRFEAILLQLIRICEIWEFYKNSLLSENGVVLTSLDRFSKYYNRVVEVHSNFIFNGVDKNGNIVPVALMKGGDIVKNFFYLVGNEPTGIYRSMKITNDIEKGFVLQDGKYVEVEIDQWITQKFESIC